MGSLTRHNQKKDEEYHLLLRADPDVGLNDPEQPPQLPWQSHGQC